MRVCISNELPGKAGPKTILCAALVHVSTRASALGSLCSHQGGPMAGSLVLNSAAYPTCYWELRRISGFLYSTKETGVGAGEVLPLALPWMNIPCCLLSPKMRWEFPVRSILPKYQMGRETQAPFALGFDLKRQFFHFNTRTKCGVG